MLAVPFRELSQCHSVSCALQGRSVQQSILGLQRLVQMTIASM